MATIKGHVYFDNNLKLVRDMGCTDFFVQKREKGVLADKPGVFELFMCSKGSFLFFKPIDDVTWTGKPLNPKIKSDLMKADKHSFISQASSFLASIG